MSLYIVICETCTHSGAICACQLHYFIVPTVTVKDVSLTWLNHIFVTWLSECIHMFRRFGVSVWHDLFMCVWLNCHNASTCDMTRSDLYPAIATMPFKSVRLRPRGRDSKRKWARGVEGEGHWLRSIWSEGGGKRNATFFKSVLCRTPVKSDSGSDSDRKESGLCVWLESFNWQSLLYDWS